MGISLHSWVFIFTVKRNPAVKIDLNQFLLPPHVSTSGLTPDKNKQSKYVFNSFDNISLIKPKLQITVFNGAEMEWKKFNFLLE